MSSDSRLLGFDMRRWPPTVDWSAERRATYLLRDDVERPLSLDTSVWPSAVDDAPSWIGPNPPLWEHLAELLAHQPERDGMTVIAADVYVGEDVPQPAGNGPYFDPVEPQPVDPSWKRLGYDVCDPTISALTNCGYPADELQADRERWSPKLNEHHLFNSLLDALDFRADADARVPEHAPFFVCGLYRVE